jgi:cytidylate kinase
MDGRDIGTVVFPFAEVKLFMTADMDIRANRRYEELKSKGQNINFDEVKESLNRRDYIDTTRDVSPLMQAKDSIVIDNSELSREDQLELALKIIHEKINHLSNI